jgi:hypothetical protein
MTDTTMANPPSPLTELAADYLVSCEARGLMPKTLKQYRYSLASVFLPWCEAEAASARWPTWIAAPSTGSRPACDFVFIDATCRSRSCSHRCLQPSSLCLPRRIDATRRSEDGGYRPSRNMWSIRHRYHGVG